MTAGDRGLNDEQLLLGAAGWVEPSQCGLLRLLNGGAPLGWGAAQGKDHPRLTVEQGMATNNVQKRRLFLPAVLWRFTTSC